MVSPEFAREPSAHIFPSWRRALAPLTVLLSFLVGPVRAQDLADPVPPEDLSSEPTVRRGEGEREEVTDRRSRRGSGSRDEVSADARRRVAERDDVSEPTTTSSEPPARTDEGRQRNLPTGESPTGINTQSIQLPSGEGSIEGMGESFAPVLSSGTGTFTIPIAIPAGRHGVQPSFSLSYSSSGGNGPLGIGWSLAVPMISRQTDRGTPRYVDAAAYQLGEDRFIYNGGQELVPVDSVAMRIVDRGSHYTSGGDVGEFAGWQQYRAKVEGSFMRFFRAPDGKRWVVQSLDGTRFDFGLLPVDGTGPGDLDSTASLQSEGAGGSGRVYAWLLTRMSDAHGSTVYYRYLEQGGARYLADVYYLSPASCAPTSSSSLASQAAAIRGCTAALDQYGARVHFDYESRTDAITSYVSGWGITQALRLRTVTVTVAEDAVGVRYLVRRYHLAYDPALFHSQLASLQVEGRAESAPDTYGVVRFTRTAESQLTASIVGRQLPALRFGYSAMPSSGPQVPGFGGVDATVRTVQNSPSVSLDASLVELSDVNSDGLPDVVVTDGARYRTADGRPGAGVFWNGFTGPKAMPAGRAAAFSDATVIALETGADVVLRYTNPNLLGMDVDGDGRGDYLHLPPTLGHGFITPARLTSRATYSPFLQDWAYVHTPRPVSTTEDPRIDLVRDGTFYRVLDVNNDHLTDIVRTTGTDMRTWLNLGWVPGGEGHFGHADATPTGWRTSPDPVVTCLPHDGQPLDFGNAEVRTGDMNGDGLTDLIRIRKGRITYWPGRGGPVWGEGPASCPAGFATGRHIEIEHPPAEVNAELAGVYLQDVNGDGADDVVQVRFNALDLWFNRAGRSFTDRITVGAPYAPDFAPNLTFADLDGTGTADLVYGRAGAWTYMDLLGGQQPRLLNSVHNGLGATTSLIYGSSAEDYVRDLAAAVSCTGGSCEKFTWDGVRGAGACDHVIDDFAGACVYRSGGSPVISRVVRRVQTTDNFDRVSGRAQVSTQEFAYHDGYYEGIEQEFRGFGAAEAHVLGDATVGGMITRTWFHQGRRPNDIATDRLVENPEEALKGATYRTEVFDEGGNFLTSTFASFTVRTLAHGSDGRPISHGIGKRTDSFTYDTSRPTSGGSVTLPFVAFERVDPSTGVPTETSTETASVAVRNGHFVWTRSTSVEVDNLGQTRESVASGRLHDEDDSGLGEVSSYAEAITQHASFDFVAGTESDWLIRPTSQYVTGQDAPSLRLGETTSTFDARGDAVASSQTVVAPVTLDFSGDATANGYTYTGGVTTQTLIASKVLDAFGNTLASCGGATLTSLGSVPADCLRYSSTEYDTSYAQLPMSEAVARSSAGGDALTTSATWERGLGALLSVTDPNDVTTTVSYDGVGRKVAMDVPDVANCHPGGPEQRIVYALPDLTGLPVSYVETVSEAGDPIDAATSCASGKLTRVRSYMDGLGRPRGGAMLTPDSTEGGAIVSGVIELDARGQTRIAYDPRFIGSSTPSAAEALRPSTSIARVQAVFDPYGRAVAAVAQDGAVARTVYRASSTISYDPNDDPAQNPGQPWHHDTPTIARKDGQGRDIEQVQQLRNPGELASQVRYVHLVSRYRADGAVVLVTRRQTWDAAPATHDDCTLSNDCVQRSFTYDTAGRRVTSTDPDSDSRSGSADRAHWRYLFNRVGDLAAVRDPRGCGQNFFYDYAGRLVGEDYVGCGEAFDNAIGNLPDELAGVIGLDGSTSTPVDVHYAYDTTPAWVPSLSDAPTTNYALGRATGSEDHAQRSAAYYDARGNAVFGAKQIAVIPPANSIATSLSGDSPGVEADTSSATAAPPAYDAATTYTASTAYDAAGRPLQRVLPRDPDWELFRPSGDTSSAPTVVGTMRYDARGLPDATTVELWSGSPGTGTLVHGQDVLTQATYDAYNAPSELWFRSTDAGERLTQTYAYDVRHRPRSVRVERGGNTVTGMSGTLNAVTVPFHEVYDFDRANNLVGTTSYAGPGALPSGRRATRRTIAQDSLYRVAQVSMEYLQDDLTWSAHDAATDWRDERTMERGDVATGVANDLQADPMRSRPSPMLAPLPSERVQDLMYEYDWLANMTVWEDDAQSFHERSIGEIGNGADGSDEDNLRPSALYIASNLPQTEVSASELPGNAGWLDLDYGESGNVVAVTVRSQCTHVNPTPGSGGKCMDDPTLNPSGRESQLLAFCACASEQHFQYRWDELNRLSEARRYDRSTGPGSDWSLAARQRYLYDGANGRVVKQTLGMPADAPSETRAALSVPTERVHLYVMPADYERVGVVPDRSVPTAPTYQGSVNLGTESEYGVAGTKLVWKPGSDLSGLERDRRLTMPIGDLLGTASAVVDLDSGAMTEMATFYPNGGREMHWMTEDASLARERNAFTGKQEDEEVGVTYFGERYLVQRVGRWATPDPLSVHAVGGGEAENTYHYVSGNTLQARDCVGLDPTEVPQDRSRGMRARRERRQERREARRESRRVDSSPMPSVGVEPPEVSSPPTANTSGYILRLRIDVPGRSVSGPNHPAGPDGTDSGHAWVVFERPDGASISVGYYPNETGFRTLTIDPVAGKDGILRDDGTHAYEYEASFNVSRDQWDAALIAMGRQDGTRWSQSHSCINAALDVLAASGVSLPTVPSGTGEILGTDVAGVFPGQAAITLHQHGIGQYVSGPAGTPSDDDDSTLTYFGDPDEGGVNSRMRVRGDQILEFADHDIAAPASDRPP